MNANHVIAPPCTCQSSVPLAAKSTSSIYAALKVGVLTKKALTYELPKILIRKSYHEKYSCQYVFQNAHRSNSKDVSYMRVFYIIIFQLFYLFILSNTQMCVIGSNRTENTFISQVLRGLIWNRDATAKLWWWVFL